ncbi:Eco57I restriction-modification methylase domain-containing protein [Verminephrobacter eiseniae]|uniref:Eco57I restriction-modification methylase domain-containing protein n=1 Tax=Verminephrobacter eiseniae TaxID=364317 RepID=UPI0022378500|nr:DNA methyltransferase [Verminephrobacter eiseniae]MCW5235254.1 ATP-binding protein [Verminephrobacter eiseniae]
MAFDFRKFQQYLGQFEFEPLFVDVLGWNRPAQRNWEVGAIGETAFQQRGVAELAGVAVLQIVVEGGWPDEALRNKVWREVAKRHHENLLIFTDAKDKPAQSLWYWVKRGKDAETGKPNLTPRRHEYFRGQPVNLFASKLQAMVVELSELDASGRIPVLEVARRMESALDVEKTTKKFFKEYQEQHLGLLESIEGINDERDRRWYASVALNRLMFIWFLQKKGFLAGGDFDYLPKRLAESKKRGKDKFFGEFLDALFFEAFAKPDADRSDAVKKLTGAIPYLNGGLFLPHKLELDAQHQRRLGRTLKIPDAAFEGVFAVFGKFTWYLDDTPGGNAEEINPDVLGYIFEKYINQKAFGAYYTRPEITAYLADRSIHALVLERINQPAVPELHLPAIEFPSVADLLAKMDSRTALKLVKEVLPGITILDPAVGSGAFLVAALKSLINIYYAVVGRAELGASAELKHWLQKIQKEHASVGYWVKRRIVTDNLYGVDIMEEACEIAKLRLFLSMVSSVRKGSELEPLPNIDFNILPGNSLIGLMRVDAHEFDQKQDDLFKPPFRRLLDEKNRELANYRHAADLLGQDIDLQSLRDRLNEKMAHANGVINELLRDQFEAKGVKFDQATWDEKKADLGKPKKRRLTRADIDALHPLHWGYAFDEVMQKRGGFDIVLTNPPWEVFKPQAKEFFADHSNLVSKNKMTIKEFEKEQVKLLKHKDVREAWLEYENRFPHVSAWFRAAPEYSHQSAIVNGKKTGSDINLYKLFVERCFHLLRAGGHCGIVIPSGIYTDLGATGLRDLLFTQTRIQGLFGFENRKTIFEGVDSRFKFVVLTFEKTAQTAAQKFPAAFMRLDVAELDRFPEEGAVSLDVDIIKRLSPESYSLMEFKDEMDVRWLTTAAKWPTLSDQRSRFSSLRFTRESDPTSKPELFFDRGATGRSPLLEGRNIHQYTSEYSQEFRFWSNEENYLSYLNLNVVKSQLVDHRAFRLGFRKIARNTDQRTMIATIIPPSYVAENLQTLVVASDNGKLLLEYKDQLYLCAVFNSFVFDALLRLKVTANINFHFVYGTQSPDVGIGDMWFERISSRAAKLICTTPEFDALTKEVGLRDHRDGVTDPAVRARLRAEIDGLVAHLYGLSDEEFLHILGTFPLVPESTKVDAYNAYRKVAQGSVQ